MFVFLFTDLQASTRLWEEHPEAMGPALATHDEILRTAVTTNHGEVVKATGDGLMATFTAIPDCVTACLEAQRSLTSTDWGLPETLRVRMGVNVGDAEPRDGDYYGPAVNRAARIMAAGHGGQVLLSEVAAKLATPTLPQGSGLVDLGSHRLKDLTEPEQLFQLTHADLELEFPPLATLDSTPNNLPLQVSEFFGRETELAAVHQLLAHPGSRLVTLTGPGGTGKTRLALQASADVVDAYPDGVYFVDLASERTPDAAFEAMLRDLGLSSSKEGSALQTLKSKLRSSRMLLVLDNFEQVTDAGAGVAELLQHCPTLEIIVTSREALNVRGEHVFAVPTLGLATPHASTSEIAEAPAVQLFVERATAARSGFSLTDDNAHVIAEITERLDGLPLAIEVAAARLAVFSTEELRDRLRERFDVLGKGARDLPDRQRTLRSTIEWSYELLEPDECRLFEIMSVFAGARLDAIEAVAEAVSPEVDALDALASLVAKSLVRSVDADGSRRFSMLQTIGGYAAERLEADPETAHAVRRAHAEFFTNVSASRSAALAGPRRETVLAELSSEIGNLRIAWSHWEAASNLEQLNVMLDALWGLTEARGWYHAAVQLTTDLLRVLSTTEHSPERDAEEMVLRTSRARAVMATKGFTSEIESEFKRALALSGSTQESAGRGPVLRALASYYMNVADMAQSAEMGRQLLDLAIAEGDEAMIVEGHVVLGVTLPYIENIPSGLDHLDRAIDLFDPEVHSTGRLRLGTSPGVVARFASALLSVPAGLTGQADARARDGLELARQLDHPFSIAYALHHAGFLALTRSDFDRARDYAIELSGVAAKHDYPVWQALATIVHGVADCGLGRPTEGLERSEAGAASYQDLTTPPVFWPLLLVVRATGFVLSGQPEVALGMVDDAIALTGSESVYPDFRIFKGDILAMLPDSDLDRDRSRISVSDSRRQHHRGPAHRNHRHVPADRMWPARAGPRATERSQRHVRDVHRGPGHARAHCGPLPSLAAPERALGDSPLLGALPEDLVDHIVDSVIHPPDSRVGPGWRVCRPLRRRPR